MAQLFTGLLNTSLFKTSLFNDEDDLNSEDSVMKKLMMIAGLATAISTPLSSYAQNYTEYANYGEDLYQEEPLNSVSLKEASTSGLAAIIGGFAAGPVGVIFGAAGGMSLGQTLTKADHYDELVTENHQAQQQLAELEKQLLALQQQHKQQEQVMHALAVNRLELQLLFRTGHGSLSEENKDRLDELAEFLHNNPQLKVRLHGYADPRGEEAYNQQLSEQRSQSVWQALLARGIPSERIEWRAHGEANHSLSLGDVDAYALERRVTIELYDQDSDGQVAASH